MLECLLSHLIRDALGSHIALSRWHRVSGKATCNAKRKLLFSSFFFFHFAKLRRAKRGELPRRRRRREWGGREGERERWGGAITSSRGSKANVSDARDDGDTQNGIRMDSWLPTPWPLTLKSDVQPGVNRLNYLLSRGCNYQWICL